MYSMEVVRDFAKQHHMALDLLRVCAFVRGRTHLRYSGWWRTSPTSRASQSTECIAVQCSRLGSEARSLRNLQWMHLLSSADDFGVPPQ